MNKILLTGHLGNDVEVKYIPSGKCVANFDIAVKRQGKDQQTDWVSVVVWEKTAEFAGNFLKKGSHIGVEGRLQTRSYENKEGHKVKVVEVVGERLEFLDSKQQPTTTTTNEQTPDVTAGMGKDVTDEEIPF